MKIIISGLFDFLDFTKKIFFLFWSIFIVLVCTILICFIFELFFTHDHRKNNFGRTSPSYNLLLASMEGRGRADIRREFQRSMLTLQRYIFFLYLFCLFLFIHCVFFLCFFFLSLCSSRPLIFFCFVLFVLFLFVCFFFLPMWILIIIIITLLHGIYIHIHIIAYSLSLSLSLPPHNSFLHLKKSTDKKRYSSNWITFHVSVERYFKKIIFNFNKKWSEIFEAYFVRYYILLLFNHWNLFSIFLISFTFFLI